MALSSLVSSHLVWGTPKIINFRNVTLVAWSHTAQPAETWGWLLGYRIAIPTRAAERLASLAATPPDGPTIPPPLRTRVTGLLRVFHRVGAQPDCTAPGASLNYLSARHHTGMRARRGGYPTGGQPGREPTAPRPIPACQYRAESEVIQMEAETF
jgi:hypothetical protein